MPVIAGAQPYSHAGGSTGVLLCHGFTGSPHSLRPWAEYLAEAGLSVSVPRLPGHGTTWQEMSRTRWEDWYAEVDRGYEDLRGRSGEIFVMGLSMGACLALRMAGLPGQLPRGHPRQRCPDDLRREPGVRALAQPCGEGVRVGGKERGRRRER